MDVVDLESPAFWAQMATAFAAGKGTQEVASIAVELRLAFAAAVKPGEQESAPAEDYSDESDQPI